MPLVLMVVPPLCGQEEPVFRAGVSLVKVDVQVTDRSGRVVRGLTVADFTVLDDGRPQRIVHFGEESEPLDLVLLLDVSGSMHKWLEELAATARGALGALLPGDRVAVMLFARESAVREALTGDFAAVQNQIRESVRDRTLGSGTAINTSIIAAARYIGAQPRKGRRAVLIVTDNLSLNYRVPDEDVIRELYGADAVLNAILIGKQKRPDPPRPGRYVNPDFTPADVFKLAEETGGEAVEARKVGESFARMIERIRARYSLQYDAPPSPAGVLHRIQVQLAPVAVKRVSNVNIRARTGYYAPK